MGAKPSPGRRPAVRSPRRIRASTNDRSIPDVRTPPGRTQAIEKPIKSLPYPPESKSARTERVFSVDERAEGRGERAARPEGSRSAQVAACAGIVDARHARQDERTCYFGARAVTRDRAVAEGRTPEFRFNDRGAADAPVCPSCAPIHPTDLGDDPVSMASRASPREGSVVSAGLVTGLTFAGAPPAAPEAVAAGPEPGGGTPVSFRPSWLRPGASTTCGRRWPGCCGR